VASNASINKPVTQKLKGAEGTKEQLVCEKLTGLYFFIFDYVIGSFPFIENRR